MAHKGLRVTSPVGDQRSTYFLALPFKFAIPLTICSAALGLLLSQSIWFYRQDFSVEIAAINVTEDEHTLGVFVSGLSFIALCAVFCTLVAIVGYIGRRKMKVKVPFAAGCSLVISAACHPPPDEVNPGERPVRWGVVRDKVFDDLPHCCFSSREVTEPVVGQEYR
jgi:hypothetical protein